MTPGQFKRTLGIGTSSTQCVIGSCRQIGLRSSGGIRVTSTTCTNTTGKQLRLGRPRSVGVSPVKAPVIVLIHGTWGSQSKWIEDGSRLREILSRRLPAGTQFHAFRWSGRNSHSARLDAAASLRTRLQNLLTQYQSRKMFLIAHSHGGNVAGYALKGFEPIEWIAGLVTMATPFIHVRPRTLLSEGADNIFRLVGVLFLLGVVPLSFVGLLFLTRNLPWLAQVVIVLIVGSIVATVLQVSPPLVAPIRSWLLRTQASLQSRLTLDGVPCIRLVAVGVVRDEARWWLSVLRRIGNLPALSFGAISRTATFSMALLALLALLLSVLVLLSQGDSVREGSLPQIVGIVLVAIPIVLLIVWVGAPILQVPMLVIPRLVRGHFWGFGGESILDNWLLDISASADPPQEWAEAEKWEIPTSLLPQPAFRRLSLHHTRIYESEVLAERIARWISAQL